MGAPEPGAGQHRDKFLAAETAEGAFELGRVNSILWTKYQPIQFQAFMASQEARREYWRRKFATDETMRAAEPNRGHRAVAKLVARGTVSAVITQNVDGLHQESGVPDGQVIELHGTPHMRPA